jgi:hypothetical protein
MWQQIYVMSGSYMNIAKIEKLIDKRDREAPFPHPNRCLAIWHFPAADDDALRVTSTRRVH